MTNAQETAPPRRVKTGAHPVVPVHPEIDYAALAAEISRSAGQSQTPEGARLLTAALGALPPRAVSWLVVALFALATVYGAQLRAIWGLPERVAAMEQSLTRIETKLGTNKEEQ